MVLKKKSSLELSVNAIVIIVLAITMLGLGLGFLREMFSKSLSQVEDQLKGLEKQRIDALLQDCDSGLCLESRKVDLKKNDQKDIWMVIYNKFDCDLSGDGVVKITVAEKSGGSTDFGSGDCQMIETEGSQCSDIIIQSISSKQVIKKTKEAILVRIKAKSSAKNTVYSYDVAVNGMCTYANSVFKLEEKMTLDINVEG
jgi:hypothetical protein